MHAVVDRERIYAALGVPEMWVLTKEGTLSAQRLDQGKWQPTERSISFPFLRVADLNPFIARIGVTDDITILADFSQWLEQLKASQPAK